MKKYGIMPVNEQSIALAVSLIRSGEVVVIPTDTVYGVVADPCNANAVEKIFNVKHRPRAKTVQILLESVSDALHFGVHIPEALALLEDEFMPGPLSLIGQVNIATTDVDNSPRLATTRQENDGTHTQAVRVPDNPVSLTILQETGALAASSANLSGMQAASTAQEAYNQLGDTVSLYLDGGQTPGPVASTVVAWDTGAHEPVILREGVISEDKIRAVLA